MHIFCDAMQNACNIQDIMCVCVYVRVYMRIYVSCTALSLKPCTKFVTFNAQMHDE